MTTIAWDGRTLAADRLADVGCLVRTKRKIYDCGEFWYAGCGAAHELVQIADWIRGLTVVVDLLRGDLLRGDPPPRLEEGGGYGIAVHKESGVAYHVVGKVPALLRYEDTQQADGSGRDFAISAMAFGRTAVEAVEFAARFDLQTGGEVDSVEIRK